MGLCGRGAVVETKKKRVGLLRKVFLLTSVALTLWLIWRLGPGPVWATLAAASLPRFGFVVGAYVIQQTLGTLALWLLGTVRGRPGWRATTPGRLARVRFVGEVLNYAMPTGAIGGEPYKLAVLGRAEGRRRALEALSAAKFLHVAAIGPFSATVFFISAILGTGGSALYGPFLLLGTAFVAMAVIVWAILLWSLPARVTLGLLYRFRASVPRPLLKARMLLQLDRAASRHIRRSPAKAVVVYCLYTGMWWAAALEWAAIAWVLGMGHGGFGIARGGLFECATILTALVPMPAGMGTQEAGKMALADMLGFAAGAGLAMSLVRRAREMLMVAAGAALGFIFS